MDELLSQIKDLCEGKSEEEIEQMISESIYADNIPNAAVLAKYFASLSAEPEDEAVTDPDDEPTADVDMD
jgi:hypothetical protein